ncbi:hypothetical protein K505DRAFT_342158 [Melanomma pulvis-pyrius CBS 109.77]|uniref:BTB domain-containing protein n=1 Tax=Melanomma pulvis-pyrius CBS 109.77 TaxID=1314802 RepID=A0A6A6WWN5_9PLEO|nr:hypothetical protein K505DRAFT_342158 [Melanomma pulvis-pyrius CBS 109.77]
MASSSTNNNNTTPPLAKNSKPVNDCGIAPFPAYDPEKVLRDNRQENIDIRQTSFAARQEMRNGISICIRCDNQWDFLMPWRLFQAVSTAATQVDTSDPLKLTLALPGNIDQKPFMYLVNWLVGALSTKRVASVKSLGSFAEDLALLRAAKLLGMHKYVQDIFNYRWGYLKNNIPTYEEIDVILSLALSREDPFFCCIAGRLAHLRLKKAIPNMGELDRYLAMNPCLGEAVSECTEKFIKKLKSLRKEGTRA